MGGESLALPDLYELRPMPGSRVRHSNRGTNWGRGATRAVRNASEDVARPHTVGVGMLPRTPVDPRDDVTAIAADVDVYRSAASPAPGDEKRRAMDGRVSEWGGDTPGSDRCGHCGQKDTQSLSAHARVLLDRPRSGQLCAQDLPGGRPVVLTTSQWTSIRCSQRRRYQRDRASVDSWLLGRRMGSERQGRSR